MADKTDMQERLEDYQQDFEKDRKNREEGIEDLEFVGGNQWDVLDLQQRQAAGRPSLVINNMPKFIRQVVGDIQQNKPAIRVSPDGQGSDEDRAEIYNGLIRNIQRRSENTNPFITACEQAASCGIGHFRIISEYLPGNPFHQDLSLLPIYNPFAVVWNAAARAKDRSDATRCHIITGHERKVAEKKWGKNFGSWDSLDDLQKLWNPTQDTVKRMRAVLHGNRKNHLRHGG